MTVVPDANARTGAPLLALAPPTPEERPDVPDMLDELIASHRGALLALAPHQEERAARLETGWHIDHLGLLLRLREDTEMGEEDHDRHRTP